MAKKKKYSPKRKKAVSHAPSRRRRVGATALNANNKTLKTAVTIGSLVLGFMYGDKVPGLSQIKTAIGDKLDSKIVAGAEGLGGYLLAFKKGKKKGLIQIGLGGILVGDAAKSLLKSFGMSGIGPYGRIPALGSPNGSYGRIPALGNRAGSFNPHGGLNGTYNPHGTLSKVMSGAGLM